MVAARRDTAPEAAAKEAQATRERPEPPGVTHLKDEREPGEAALLSLTLTLSPLGARGAGGRATALRDSPFDLTFITGKGPLRSQHCDLLVYWP